MSNIKDELQAIEKAIVEKVQKAEEAAANASKSTEDFKTEINALLEEKAELTGQKVEDIKNHLDEVSAAVKAMKEDNDPSKLNKMFKGEIADQVEKAAEGLKKQVENPERGFKVSFETKAVQDMTQALAFTGDVVDNPRRPGIVQPIERTIHIRDLVPGGSMTGNAYGYVVESGGEGTIDYVLEGAEKKQIDFDYEFVEAKAAKIAAYQKVSDEMLADVPALLSFTSGRMVKKLLKVEDTKMLYGSTATGDLKGLSLFSGITDLEVDPFTSAITTPSTWQALDAAIATMKGVDVMPNVILMNPADYQEAIANTQKDFEVGARFFFNAQTGISSYSGIPIVEHTAVSAGDLFLMDVSEAQWLQRSGIRVDVSSENEDDFIKNMYTIRVEERIALALYNEKAVGYGGLAAIKAAID